MMMMMMMMMMMICPKAGSFTSLAFTVSFTPPGDETSEVTEVVSRCLPHRQ